MSIIGFIGAGNMATAIIRGVVNAGILAPCEITVTDIDAEKLKPFQQMGANVTDNAKELTKSCKYILMAVKPQNYEAMLKEIAPYSSDDKVFISIAAGISGHFIKEILGEKTRVVLVMPNTPILVGKGASALSRVEPTTKEEFSFVRGLFAAGGEAVEITPDKMNEIIPVNGSSPAFIYLFTKVFVDRAEEMGFEREMINRLFCASLVGAAEMMMTTGKTHDELIKMVSSPGGTTLKGLEALERCGFETAVRACIDDCVERAYQLGK